MLQLLDGWLRHKSELVNFEAAKAICHFPDLTDAEAVQAIHVLQLLYVICARLLKVSC